MLREKTDSADGELLRLFERRLRAVRSIAEYKREQGIPAEDEGREADILSRVNKEAASGTKEYAEEFFRDILRLSKEYQRRLFSERFGLIGGRLSHSYSPLIHSLLGEYLYELFPMKENEIQGFMKEHCFRGINVTIPYKETVMPYCDTISEEAGRIGAVNTVVKDPDGRLHGYNTDYYGFSYLLDRTGAEVSGKKALILGSGGSSKMVRAVLSDRKAREITVVSRSGEDNYGNIYKHSDAEIIINTTPVGMYPDCGVSPITLESFPRCVFVADLIYNPAVTKLLFDAKELGIMNSNGLPMLVAQAVKSAELFTGKIFTSDIIETVIKKVNAAKKNVVLIGMPGCGKTVCGRLLAEKLGRQFTDTDGMIAEKTEHTPEDIILREGEAVFRRLEREACAEIGKESGCVIAVGGGAVTEPENYRNLRQNSVVVFVDRKTELLDLSGRPLSRTPGTAALLYEKRLPLYKRFCDFSVDGNGTVDETVGKILERLDK